MQTIDQAIELLTGVPAGERDEEGNLPTGSVNQLVEARLIELSERQRDFASPPEEEKEGETEAADEEEGEE